MRHVGLSLIAFAALAAVVAPVSAQPRPAAASAPDYRLTCDGPFRRSTSEADLRRMYGAANVRRERVYAVEDNQVDATVLFPRDPARRAEIFWSNPRRHTGFSSIRTGGRTWVGRDGLRVGSPIADVERVNGGPFDISGFGWDYGGQPNFEGGRLAGRPDACNVGFDFEPDQATNSEQAIGDATFRSDSAAVRSQRPRVGRMTLSLN